MMEPGADFHLDEAARKYFQELCRFLYHGRYVTDLDLAKDIVQETFIELMCKHTDFSSPKIGRLLRTAAVRNSIDYHRRKKTEKKRHDQYIKDNECPVSDQPDQAKIIEELFNQLKAEINRLPPERRRAIMEIYFNGKTPKQVARELGISEHTVKGNKYKAIDTLTKILQELRKKGLLP